MYHNHKIQIAMITSRFNEEVTTQLKSGALSQLKEHGLTEEQVTQFDVPGAIEIPLIAQQCARQKKYNAIICLGAVIRGETSHYDYVCEQVSVGCQQVMMAYSIPVVFGILTTENTEQALERTGGVHGHKGRDAVDAALEMIGLMAQFP